MESIISKLSRLAVAGRICSRCQVHTAAYPLAFRATPVLGAEPMKKKKKTDGSQVFQKEQRKKRKLEKAIKKISSRGVTLKPVNEIDWDPALARTREKRLREGVKLSEEEIEQRSLLVKEWTRYQLTNYKIEARKLRTAMMAQEEALNALREESEDLYQEAIQPDMFALPHSWQGPLNTPPLAGYEPPDGEYSDTTKDFEDQPQLSLLENLKI